MNRPHGTTVSSVIELLETQGPMTAFEIARRLGQPRNNIASVLVRLCTPSRTLPKRVHIASWTREVPEGRYLLRAVYDVGDEPDAKRPAPISSKESTRKYRAKQDLVQRKNFVFNLGAPRIRRKTDAKDIATCA